MKEQIGDTLSVEDINKSTKRILHTLTKKNSVTENKVGVGTTSYEKNEFHITFRPSLGLEILNCVDRSPRLLKEIFGFGGNGHKGLTQLFSEKEIEETIVKPFIEYRKETQCPPEQVKIYVDGMSAGAHRAVETAIYLKQHESTRDYKTTVLRYGDSKTFDEPAVNSIHNLLGKENIYSFHGKGDKIVEFMDMPEGAGLGTRLDFLATDSEDYKKRIETCAYTGMDSNFKNALPNIFQMLEDPFTKMGAQILLGIFQISPDVIDFLTPTLWELHQPSTYCELSPLSFQNYLEKKK